MRPLDAAARSRDDPNRERIAAMQPASLTDRQKAWFATLRDGIERETGRTIAQWAEIARACPETAPRARLAWMKAEHGLGQNRASVILAEAFPQGAGWAEPDALAATLWHDTTARAIVEAVRAAAIALDGVSVGQRKGFTAFSRTVQFAAVRPRGSLVLLGLAIPPASDPRLAATGRHGWSERLLAVATLGGPQEVAGIAPLLEQAWSRS
jgi:hypothetical protein